MVKWGLIIEKIDLGITGRYRPLWCLFAWEQVQLDGIQASAGPYHQRRLQRSTAATFKQSVSHNLVIFRQLRWKPHKFGYT